MDNLTNILSGSEQRVYLSRAGVATRARLASAALAKGRGSVLVSRDKGEFHELAALCRLFIPSLSDDDYHPAQTIWERPLLLMPEMRSWGDKNAWASRMAVYYALSRPEPRCVVVSMKSLIPLAIPKNFFRDRTLDLAAGSDLSPELILEQAIEWGYERAPMVSRPGELARRGDILDIFPPGYSRPVRLEFFGDTIEQMRLFDGETQRSLQELPEVTLIPASPLLLDKKGIEASVERLSKLRKEGRLSENDAYSLKKRLEEGGEGILPGIVHADAVSPETWFAGNAIWFLPGEADSAESLSLGRAAIKDELEKEEDEPRQPAGISLRRSSSPAPWNQSQCVFSEPLRIGIEEKGVNLPERDFSQFQDLFPLQEQRDRPWQTLVKSIKARQSDYRQILLSFHNARVRKKFLKLAEQDGIHPQLRYAREQKGLFALVSPFRAGANLEWDKIIILGEDIIFPRAEKQTRKAVRAFKGLDDFDSLKPGDLLVHRDYGIGRFAGLHHLDINNAANDFLLLEYSGKDKLYVPVDRLNLIQRFKGQEGLEPALDRLGSQAWANGKEKARKAIEKIAADLVEMYAYRKVAKSFHYAPPGELYHEFEATFAFEETHDQARAIQEVLDDMEKKEPMDRLVCGDVGFGKTEVALRAAFRAASEGRQTVLLCPTTVLAEQHYQTFRSRLAGFPVNVGLLSRFVPKARQKEVLKACAEGHIDILVGTHRVLSSDVHLPNLSLLVLDEEQRFGVRHKEKLKSLKKNVDVLTLTATPIPRTLQLSMSGIRDLSIIETAPVDRKPVASAVIQRDDETLRKVIERELAREGQVFWVYNRVQGLENVAGYVRELAPNARVGMAHGQMGEKELEETMRSFWHGDLDVLVSTSIVESGLDFPRANTLVVDQAQMFGLGQLYQLRGRVGRSDRQAYAFFVVPDAKKIAPVAEERLRIILDMDYLGAGFQIAMEDLRMRGAGNILGEAQSGHITRVGLDMYLEMLEDEVKKQKGLPAAETREPEINLGIPAHIPSTYIEDGKERLRCYKALTTAGSAPEREDIALGIRDRFGPFPEELRNFLAVLDFKQFIGALDVERADIHAASLKLSWRKNQKAVEPAQIVKLIKNNPEIKMFPPATLQLPFADDGTFADRLGKARESLAPLALPV